jgi:hypothetical protein
MARTLATVGLLAGVAFAGSARTAMAGDLLHRHGREACRAGVYCSHYRVPYQHEADPAAEARCHAQHTLHRAGHPLCISPHAAPSVTGNYSGYYVGGGSAHGGDARCPEEGTWGWDYVGGHLPRHVVLGWVHGRRDQGGTGAYKVDGPEVPNVFNIKLHRHASADE